MLTTYSSRFINVLSGSNCRESIRYPGAVKSHSGAVCRWIPRYLDPIIIEIVNSTIYESTTAEILDRCTGTF